MSAPQPATDLSIPTPKITLTLNIAGALSLGGTAMACVTAANDSGASQVTDYGVAFLTGIGGFFLFGVAYALAKLNQIEHHLRQRS